MNYSRVDGQVACQQPIRQQGSSAWGKRNLPEDTMYMYMHIGCSYSIANKYENGTFLTILPRIVLFGIALFSYFCSLRDRYKFAYTHVIGDCYMYTGTVAILSFPCVKQYQKTLMNWYLTILNTIKLEPWV